MTLNDDRQMLLKRFELWTSRFFIIKSLIKSEIINLAEIGCIINFIPPSLNRDDLPVIAEAKKKITALYNEQIEIIDKVENCGAIIANLDTMEILVVEDPDNKSFLSWMPGENDFLFRRISNNIAGDRLPLKRGVKDSEQRIVH
ncbi:MAG: hypothetical protein JXR91_04375 [Deltaproteobacteria bacterium]|nr:hypothetical protein [Deltaproteobacteria bacterium]